MVKKKVISGFVPFLMWKTLAIEFHIKKKKLLAETLDTLS
jgi:hypothetical protein